jgi:ATP synthase I subunit
MGEESPALPSEAPVTAAISHRRLLIEMAVLIVFGSLAGFVFAGARFGFGILFGGALAFLNYYWLKRSTAAIFDKAVSGTGARFVSLRFISRYVAIGAVILAVYFSGAMPAVAVIAGLSAFAIAVVVDGLISIFRRNT